MTTHGATEAGITSICSFPVAGKFFEPYDWKQALTHYLSGVWRGLTHNAMLQFIFADSHVALHLNAATGEYAASGAAQSGYMKTGHCLQVSNARAEVEQGLIRFLRDDTIRQLEIVLTVCSGVLLSKAENGLRVEAIGTSSKQPEWSLPEGFRPKG